MRIVSKSLTTRRIQLASATAHWLRHTGISEDVKTCPHEHVRDDAGHSSNAITDKYIDIELTERAQSAKHKLLSKKNEWYRLVEDLKEL